MIFQSRQIKSFHRIEHVGKIIHSFRTKEVAAFDILHNSVGEQSAGEVFVFLQYLSILVNILSIEAIKLISDLVVMPVNGVKNNLSASEFF